MKRFSFNLQKLLELREFEEKEAKDALAHAVAEAEKLQAELQTIAAERVRINKTRNDNVDVASLVQIEHYVNRLDVRKEELLEAFAQAQLVIEQKRAVFVERMQKRSVLDKLKEKKLFLWKKAREKDEESAVEDAVYGSFGLS